MESANEAAVAFLSNQHQLHVRPMSYTIAERMLMTKWWWYELGEFAGSAHILMEGCLSLKSKWLGDLGPYELTVRVLEGGEVEVMDSSGEFCVVCQSIQVVSSDLVPGYYRNLSGMGF